MSHSARGVGQQLTSSPPTGTVLITASDVLSIDNSEDMVCDKGDVVYTAKDKDDADTRTMLSDDELFFSDSTLEEDYLENSMMYDEDEEPKCTCGAGVRGHKRD